MLNILFYINLTASTERDDGRHGRPRAALPARHAAGTGRPVPADAAHAPTDARHAAAATAATPCAALAAATVSNALLTFVRINVRRMNTCDIVTSLAFIAVIVSIILCFH